VVGGEEVGDDRVGVGVGDQGAGADEEGVSGLEQHAGHRVLGDVDRGTRLAGRVDHAVGVQAAEAAGLGEGPEVAGVEHALGLVARSGEAGAHHADLLKRQPRGALAGGGGLELHHQSLAEDRVGVEVAVAERTAAGVGAEGLACEVVDVELGPGRQVDSGEVEPQGGGPGNAHLGGPHEAGAAGALGGAQAQVGHALAEGPGGGEIEDRPDRLGDTDQVPLRISPARIVDPAALGGSELDHQGAARRLLDPAGGQPLLQDLHFRDAGTRVPRSADRLRIGLGLDQKIEVERIGEERGGDQHPSAHGEDNSTFHEGPPVQRRYSATEILLI
jgi:hypothetical protein